jgi:hypothetical protein
MSMTLTNSAYLETLRLLSLLVVGRFIDLFEPENSAFPSDPGPRFVFDNLFNQILPISHFDLRLSGRTFLCLSFDSNRLF